MAYVYHSLYNHSPDEGHWVHSILDKAAMNICVQIFLVTKHFSFSGINTQSANAGSYGNCVLRFIRNCPTVFPQWLCHLPFPPVMYGCAISLNPSQHLLLSLFLFWPFWYLSLFSSSPLSLAFFPSSLPPSNLSLVLWIMPPSVCAHFYCERVWSRGPLLPQTFVFRPPVHSQVACVAGKQASSVVGSVLTQGPATALPFPHPWFFPIPKPFSKHLSRRSSLLCFSRCLLLKT